jgi:hydroxymethylbilane synthase
LGLESRIRHTICRKKMVPAAGQGALGIEILSSRADVAVALAPLAHIPTWLCTAAERAVSRAMGGSCSMPLAAYATLENGQLQLSAAWGDVQGQKPLVRAQAEIALGTDLAQLPAAEALGLQIAQQLQALGAH